MVGMDEVGRGAWAGPLVVGAVVLGKDFPIEGLTDSKLLSKRNRECLAEIINKQALVVSLGFVTSKEIDQLRLNAALALAYSRALESVDIPYDEIIIDGSINYLPDNPRARTVIKADLSTPAVSAASIVAKVVRDRYMSGLADRHPQFGFEAHVGYGTRRHLDAIQAHGLTLHHRRSFKPVALYGAT